MDYFLPGKDQPQTDPHWQTEAALGSNMLGLLGQEGILTQYSLGGNSGRAITDVVSNKQQGLRHFRKFPQEFLDSCQKD